MTDARDVFGVNTRKNVLSYVERAVDQDFKDALSTDEYAVVPRATLDYFKRRCPAWFEQRAYLGPVTTKRVLARPRS